MIRLRQLEEKDAKFMLEWMNYSETSNIFQNNFAYMNMEKCKQFISSSFNNTNMHFAIVDDNDDEYLGTISLKNIDYNNKCAEYAISSRKKSRGNGTNIEATKLILSYAFNDLKLNKVYLNVLSNNLRAKKFYEKNGFKYEGTFREHIYINENFVDLDWYSILKAQYKLK